MKVGQLYFIMANIWLATSLSDCRIVCGIAAIVYIAASMIVDFKPKTP